MIESLHSNLGDKSETPSSKKKKKKELDCLAQLRARHAGLSSAVLLFVLLSSTYWHHLWCQDGCRIPGITSRLRPRETAHPYLGEPL